jgi:SSS family solute:Na+ symporter
MFYFPKFSNGRGAVWGMIIAVILTTAWYMGGNPFGIDNIYIAAVTPFIVMAINHLFMIRDNRVSEEKFNSSTSYNK